MDNGNFSQNNGSEMPVLGVDIPEQNQIEKKSNKAVLVGAICGALGLALGAVGVFGLIKLTEKPIECECPSCNVAGQRYEGLEEVNYGFLKLEAASDNIVYSPLSIRNGLALLGSGASGETKAEIESVLTDAEIPKYQNIPDKLSLANAVFVRDTFRNKVLPEYISTVQNDYDGEVMYDSFESSVNMDNWVSQKTFGLIDSIGIQPSDDTRMVLANALAIQMDWKSGFDTGDTYGENFYLQDGSEIQATTMSKETSWEGIKYYVDDDVTAVSMPLDSTSDSVNLDFVAVMPSEGVDGYIETAGYNNIEDIIDKLVPASVPEDGIILNIPKFKFEYELDFQKDLETMGIVSAFDEMTADFSNMATEPLFVSEAVHKANIDFSEDGIKAAAVTAFVMDINSMVEEEPQPVIINIDHPFVFLIRDADDGTIWFTGAVYQPNLWADDQAEYYSY